MPAISVKNIHFGYKNEEVLKDLNLEIDSGEFVCILGESGCGKSTFLRLMAGLAEPESGEILIDGRAVLGAGLDRGVVFQDYSLFPWFTAGKNILLALQQKFKDVPKAELKERVLRGLKDVGLDESIYKKYPFQLSGGPSTNPFIKNILSSSPADSGSAALSAAPSRSTRPFF